MSTGRNCSAYIHYNSVLTSNTELLHTSELLNTLHTSNLRTFLIALLDLPIFLLYEVRPQCRYILPKLPTGYTKDT